MPTQEKIDRVAELQDKLERSSIVVSAGYAGMGANRMVDLRRRLREGGVELVVVKNNLLNLAADAATIPQLKDMVTGQTAIAVGYDDAAIAAKAITDAANAAGAVTINGAVVNREVAMLPAEVSRLAALPPRPTLVAQLLGNMQSPLYGLLSVLNVRCEAWPMCCRRALTSCSRPPRRPSRNERNGSSHPKTAGGNDYGSQSGSSGSHQGHERDGSGRFGQGH